MLGEKGTVLFYEEKPKIVISVFEREVRKNERRMHANYIYEKSF